MTKEFLGTNRIVFDAVNPFLDDSSKNRWREAGAPALPAIVVGGRVISVVHVSQLYSLLGIEVAAVLDERRCAWDIATIQQSWTDVLHAVEWQELTAPTPSRNRTIRDLAVNVFEFFPCLVNSRSTQQLVLSVDPQEALAESLKDKEELTRYVEHHMSAWQQFVFETFEDDAEPAGIMITLFEGRADGGCGKELGTVSFGVLLSLARNHTAMHLRQATVHLDRHGVPHPKDGLDAFALGLPTDPYGENAERMGRLDQKQLMR